MGIDRDHILSLLRRYAEGTLKREELDQLLERLNDPLLAEDFREEILQMLADSPAGDGEVPEGMASRVYSRLRHSIEESEVPVSSRFAGLYKFRAAAAVLAVLLATAISIRYLLPEEHALSVEETGAPHVLSVPLAQASDHVTLTLGDGSRIALDRIAEGTIASEGGAAIIKRKDLVDYGNGGVMAVSSIFNTIETPRAGRYQVILSDGTRVWLNAASVIRFPVRFSGTTREVELTGQAYFEVSHQSGRPFIVRTGDAQVEVYGTHFDVMGYDDDPEIRTTLLEGSVGFKKNGSLTMLRPGQQSYAARKGGAVQLRNDQDVGQVIGWREGSLHFEGEDIGQVCRALSRAFDVQLAYDDRIRDLFYASFPQAQRIEIVLKALEMTGKVKFEKNGDAWRAVPY
jgi:ferric-dicitrate binding protein FerR (iron transport regulator)